MVDEQYKTTNENITVNPYVKFNAKGVAKVTTPKAPTFRKQS
jgi:hypothetical protein